MSTANAPGARDATPRVLVVSAQLTTLRECEEMLGRGALVRTCLGARAARRAALAWEPTAIVLDHDPPAMDAAELLRLWHSTALFTPDVALYSRTGSVGLELLARRYAAVHVLSAPAPYGALARLALRMHRASVLRRGTEPSRTSGTRRRVP